jgi:hypothetical protein
LHSSAGICDDQWECCLNDIKVEYHPKSKKNPKLGYHRFEDYDNSFPETVDESPNEEPWKPFESQLDFELAEIMLDCHMNVREKQRLISWVRQCLKDPKSFTIKKVADLDQAWENAKYKATQVSPDISY